MKGMQGGNGWGREGEERAAVWSAIRLCMVPRMADVSVLVSRSVCVCVCVC